MITVHPLVRNFLPKELVLKTWADLAPYAADILKRDPQSTLEFKKWLDDRNEIVAALHESYVLRYTNMTCHTDNKEYSQAFVDYLDLIDPESQKFTNDFQKKLLQNPLSEKFDELGYRVWLRGLKSDAALFREKNIPLSTEQAKLAKEYGEIRAAMTVTLDGEEMTLQKAADRNFWTDRAKREEAWLAANERRYQDADKTDQIFDQMVALRHQTALNADHANYRDYAFQSLNRFDYGPKECLVFHEAVAAHIVPLVDKMQLRRKKDLSLDVLRPWDGAVDVKGRAPLKAFETPQELMTRSCAALDSADPFFGDTLRLMDKAGRIDLFTRANKQPGGYMMSLPETRIPFIFANATHKVDDMVTLIHEVGHAVHCTLSDDIKTVDYCSMPSEGAELASMSMELLTMDAWHNFFPNEEECNRAKYEHLERIITYLPWMARVDAFQHEIYLAPTLTPLQRHELWSKLHTRFASKVTDWSGLEKHRDRSWHNQLHIFEVPFYYIEYAIAQLGALQVWRNYKQDKKQAIAQYKAALALGYTKTLPEIYKTAGIAFDFSSNTLRELVAFVQKEMEALQ